MGTRDPRIDAYIAKSADFAQPVLTHLREVVHTACPDVEESMKWSTPHFMYHGMLCGMSAFKAHCGFGFWKGALVVGRAAEEDERVAGQFGRITSIEDLPPKRVLVGYIREAMRLNEEGIAVPRAPKRAAKPAAVVPAELTAALARNGKARAVFDAFAPSHRREYCEWIAEAKRDETKARRVEQAVEWLAEGKSRNWKYERG